MDVHEVFIHPPFEAPPPAFIPIFEAAKRKRTPTDRDKARRFNESKKPKGPINPTGITLSRETVLNRGAIKRSQRRSMRPH
jgi:hypothetical protein